MKTVATPAEAEQTIRNQQADIAVVFRTGLYRTGTWSPAYRVDGADPNMAQLWFGPYARAVLKECAEGTAVNSRMLYNPQMKLITSCLPSWGCCSCWFQP